MHHHTNTPHIIALWACGSFHKLLITALNHQKYLKLQMQTANRLMHSSFVKVLGNASEQIYQLSLGRLFIQRVTNLRAMSSQGPIYTADYLSKKLREALGAERVDIEDLSNCGCGMKFDAVIVSNQFEGKPLLQRQRLVNQILSDEMKHIHAFTMKTLTPSQWKEKGVMWPARHRRKCNHIDLSWSEWIPLNGVASVQTLPYHWSVAAGVLATNKWLGSCYPYCSVSGLKKLYKIDLKKIDYIS